MATTSAPARRRRPGPGWIPNQHGAWAMLAAPLLVGILGGGFAWVDLPLAAFWFVGYFAFFATSLWLKARRRAKWWPPVRAYSIAAGALGLVVAAMRPDLLVWIPAFILPLGVGLWAAAARRERDLLAGITTVVGSGLMTVVAYDAGSTGSLDRGWQLALVQFLYFAGTVSYVKSAIRERGNRGFLALSVGFHLLATLAMVPLSWWLVGLFAVLTIRAAITPLLAVSPKTLGIGEIVATVAVAVVSLLVL